MLVRKREMLLPLDRAMKYLETIRAYLGAA
jgi:hypothetical protein